MGRSGIGRSGGGGDWPKGGRPCAIVTASGASGIVPAGENRMATAEQRQFSPATLRRLKLVVVGLGLAFLAAFALFIWLIVSGAARGPRGDPAGWTRTLDLPAGAEIAAIAAVGDSLVVHVRGPNSAGGGGERLLVVEPRTGRIIGTMTPR